MPTMTETEVFETFAQIVARSLRIDVSQVKPEMHLNDLGACGGPMTASMGFRMKCTRCGEEITLRSGEELNRKWVREYYEKEYRPPASVAVSASVVQ